MPIAHLVAETSRGGEFLLLGAVLGAVFWIGALLWLRLYVRNPFGLVNRHNWGESMIPNCSPYLCLTASKVRRTP